MPVRFIVNPALPADVSTITLSYTFYLNDAATAQLHAPQPLVMARRYGALTADFSESGKPHGTDPRRRKRLLRPAPQPAGRSSARSPCSPP